MFLFFISALSSSLWIAIAITLHVHAHEHVDNHLHQQSDGQENGMVWSQSTRRSAFVFNEKEKTTTLLNQQQQLINSNDNTINRNANSEVVSGLRDNSMLSKKVAMTTTRRRRIDQEQNGDNHMSLIDLVNLENVNDKESEIHSKRFLDSSQLNSDDLDIWVRFYDSLGGNSWTCPVNRFTPCFTKEMFLKQNELCRYLGIYVQCEKVSDGSVRITEISLNGNNLRGIFNPSWISSNPFEQDEFYLPNLAVLSVASKDLTNMNYLSLASTSSQDGSSCAKIPRCHTGSLACLFLRSGINVCPLPTPQPTPKETTEVIEFTDSPTQDPSNLELSPTEKKIWNGLYFSLGGKSWTECNSPNARDDPCKYCPSRVKCVKYPYDFPSPTVKPTTNLPAIHIQSIDLSKNNLKGWFPEEAIEALSFLKYADFSGNSFTNRQCLSIPRCFSPSLNGDPFIKCNFTNSGPNVKLCIFPTYSPTPSPSAGTTIVEETDAPTASPTFYVVRPLHPTDLIAWNSFFDTLGGETDFRPKSNWIACGSRRFRNDPCTVLQDNQCGKSADFNITCQYIDSYWRITGITLRNNNITDRWFPTVSTNAFTKLKLIDMSNTKPVSSVNNNFTNLVCLSLDICKPFYNLPGDFASISQNYTCNFNNTGVKLCSVPSPTANPTLVPTLIPTVLHTQLPTVSPSKNITRSPTIANTTLSPTILVTTLKPSSSPIPVQQGTINADDLKAWQAFYSSLKGKFWSKCNSNAIYNDPCNGCIENGQMIVCEEINNELRITVIILQSNNLRGWLPDDAVSQLSALKFFDVSNSFSSSNPANVFLNTRCLNIPNCSNELECTFSLTSLTVCDGPAPTKNPTPALTSSSPSKNPTRAVGTSPTSVPTIQTPTTPMPSQGTLKPTSVPTLKPTQSPLNTLDAGDLAAWQALYDSLGAGDGWVECGNQLIRDDPCGLRKPQVNCGNTLQRGIKCSAVNGKTRITEIKLKDNGLYGWIPASALQNLDALIILDFSSSSFSLTPNEFTNLDCVKYDHCYDVEAACLFEGSGVELCTDVSELNSPTQTPTSPTLSPTTSAPTSPTRPTMFPTVKKPTQSPVPRVLLKQDLVAWQAIYEHMNGEAWVDCKDAFNDPCNSCSLADDLQVKCDQLSASDTNGQYYLRITSITMRNNNVRGFVPSDAIELMTQLKLFDISNAAGTELTEPGANNVFVLGSAKCVYLPFCYTSKIICDISNTGTDLCSPFTPAPTF